MFLDILGNNITINKRLANLVGLKTALYTSELIDLYSSAFKQGLLDEEHYMMKPDQDIVTTDTTLDATDQAKAMANLLAANLVEADDEKIRIRSDRIVALITSNDTEALTQILEDTKADKETQKKSKEDFIKEAVKKSIKEDNKEVRNALCNWVDTMYSVKHPISKSAAHLFVSTINEYTKDPVAKLRIVEIAIMKSYVDAKWAVELYNKEQTKSISSRLPTTPATRLGTPQKIATDMSQLGKKAF